MGNFYTDVIQKHPLFNSKERVSQWTMLEPETRKRVAGIITDAEDMGFELTWFETYRSQERQEQLFLQGATQLKNVGVHHYGLACDLVRLINGELVFKGDYSFVGELASRHGLLWGGSWAHMKDSFHVQRCSISKQPLLFSGAWYPDDAYDPTKGPD